MGRFDFSDYLHRALGMFAYGVGAFAVIALVVGLAVTFDWIAEVIR